MAEIDWTAPAEFRQVGIEHVVRGDLGDCVRAYRQASEADRHGAMVICEALVPMAEGRPGLKTVTDDDLVWLASQLPA